MNNAKRIFQILFSQTRDFVFFIIYSFLISIFVLLDLLVIKAFVDKVIVDGNYNDTSLYVGLFVIVFVAFASTVILKSRTKTILTTNVSLALAKEAYTNVLNADIYDCEKEEVKEKVSKIIDNSEYIGNEYLRFNVLRFVESLICVMVLFTSMLFIKPILALIVLIGLPIYFALDKGMEKIVQYGKETNENATKNINRAINNNYKQIRSVKLLNSIDYELARFDSLANRYLRAKNHKNFANNLSGKVLELIFNSIVLAIVLGLCGFLATEESYNITSGVVVVFLVSIPYLFFNFKTMISCNIFTSSVSTALSELDVLNHLKTEKKTEPVSTLEEIHSIRFKDVTYTNEKGFDVVNNISFEIKRGEKLGILTFEDETKDALFDMITKLNKPKLGEISINNCDIAKLNTNYLRDIITSIFTHFPQVNGNISEYVSYPYEFDEYKFNDALYRSGLKDFVSNLPEKENTNINDSKITDDVLYRLLFANAFFKDSKIYLLKDATNNLSVSTELDMVNEIVKLKNKIVITITDRAYCLNKYDKILVIKNGEVIEYGTYTELMQNKTSVYYKLTRRPSTKLEKIS